MLNTGTDCLPHTFPQNLSGLKSKSAFVHRKFVHEAIEELLQSDRVTEVQQPPLVINPLSVSVQSNGKKRLILDLRHVNKTLEKLRIKYDDWKVAMSYFAKDSFMLSFDLKSGYHHIEIASNDQTYLGFAWQSDNQEIKFYVFTVLPFGLSTAPHIFTKTLKPLVKHWRHQGICVALFLDDGWLTESSYDSARNLAIKVKNDLNAAGFITNDEKSTWDPTQRLTWLGLVWDSAQGTLEITSSRIDKIFATIDNMTEHDSTLTARRLAAFTGQIISIGPVAGNVTRIMTRHCCLTIACAEHWDSALELDTYCLDEISFWKNNLSSLKARDCFLVKKPHCFVYSDASATGCGAKLTLDKTHISHELWKEEDREKSSTWRELSAISFSLEAFSKLLEYSHVKWYTDNQAAAKIVEVGSMKPDLHALAIQIFRFCASKHINLEIEWIPRTENQQADAISRLIDLDDWQLSNWFFQSLEQLWGPHTVDCLATYYNTKIPRFYSRFWNPGAEGVDFFAQNLENENCLLVPQSASSQRFYTTYMYKAR